MAKPTHNFLGESIGTLLVIEWLGIRKNKRGATAGWWKCYCSGCLRTYEKRTEALVLGHSCKSCCLRKERSIERSIFLRYQNDARLRHHPFLLTFEEFIVLCSASCHYCGCAPAQEAKLSRYQTSIHDNRSWVYNGIDQIVPGAGYTRSNAVTCCGPCNVAKHGASAADFIARCKRIAIRFAGTL